MAKVKVLVQPSGLINGQYWPASGKTLELPDLVAEEMAAAGNVEIVEAAKVEKRPASKAGEEKR